jgi:hypothetical protein
MKNLLNDKIGFIAIIITISLFFSACSKNKLLLTAYSSPKKQKEVNQMLEVGDSSSEYLSMEIYENEEFTINGVDSSDRKTISKLLVVDIKKYITQTNFISLNDVADQSAVSLDMKILQLNYNQDGGKIDGIIEVEFNIRKDQPLYTQKFSYSIHRFSRAGSQGLPSKIEILSQASNYLAKKLIKDISPLITRKLVELATLPSELKYTIQYAKAGNYDGAIKGMLKYKGSKEYEYYLNLAIYYEGLAAQEDDMAYLVKANESYKLSIENGGADEKIVINAKIKFDNFYKIVKKIAEQKIANAKANGNNKYKLLD